MTIFHVPSWYPYPQSPYNGIFIKEMIEAYAAIYTSDISIISNFYQLQFDIRLGKPLQSVKQFLRYATTSNLVEINHSANLTELQSKLLAGSKPIFGLRIDSQAAIAEKHFNLLIKRKIFPDILHAHVCYPGGVIAKKLSSKFKIPYIISEQSGTALLHTAFEKYHLKEEIMDAFNNAKEISALSTFHKKELEKLKLNNIRIIPNLVNESVFKPGNFINKNEFEFFTLGWIRESKGIKDLLCATEKLVKEDQKFKIKIGGTGNQSDEFKELSVSLGIDTYIEWAGPLSRAQTVEAFQRCDCFILPSKTESLGVVYLEAIACGKPVIATNCGGPADIINHNNGILVETGNVDAIANAMSNMIARGKEYNSELIRKDFLERFSRQAVAKKIKEFYNDALER